VSELVFLFSADADIQTAFEFYEAFQAGRGEVFMRHLDVAFGQLRVLPEIAPVFHESYRRLLVHGFPYGIFYTIAGGRIIISGVMDLRQDPDTIRQRLRGRSA
jgi:plasmid stabilization system protein ParE